MIKLYLLSIKNICLGQGKTPADLLLSVLRFTTFFCTVHFDTVDVRRYSLIATNVVEFVPKVACKPTDSRHTSKILCWR